MNETVRPEEIDLAERLEADPGRFEPTTAFRVAQEASDVLALASGVGVSTAPLAVDGFRRRSGEASLRTAFPGLLGPVGALPPAYNEVVMREERNRARGLKAFLDMLSARMVELFVDASEKYRLPRLMRWRGGAAETFRNAVFALTGFRTARLRETAGVDDELVLRFSGFFAARTRNASNLEAMLGEFTGLPVRVELFRGRWLSVPEAEQSRMTRDEPVQLGVDAMAGAAIRDFSGGFRVVIGPLAYADYLALAPGGRAARELFALTRLFVGSGLDFDMQVILRKEDVPFCNLGGKGGERPRLGWNSWALGTPAVHDCGDAILTRHAILGKGGGGVT
ncbi:type VI secretion system baseplate subunit TssG [Nitratireductor sp. ZSWI3]|uniref:type VI secretion system baseplate subunit TssG n=1 Tax=Nitratireductor sp. ZSWI3 TaxID=2966359 RepID=UPI00215003E6|nr:type VI secretion system baseplate subunit TssG [Nitratireductor sp. ZSWI3]MCR4266311.1 type VI secretion system baseplate subunit TssG [Nitratireductor sp. ZSWI3]